MPRRLVTIPALFLLAATATLSAPLWILVLTGVGVFRRRRFIALRLCLFVLIYSWMELFGVIGMTGAWALGQSANQPFHYSLQRVWANSLFRAMRWLLQLRLVVEGDEVLNDGPFLLLMRHTSIADTVLPAALLSSERGFRLRYVLKKELRGDPCLDIAGGRLPNHFVDRKQVDESELQAIATLARGMSEREAVVIYPEGTRFTEAVREKVLAKLRASDSSRLSVAESLKNTLLPKIRGVAALHEAAPELDVVFFAHHGFEGFSTMASMLSGELVGCTVNIRFWRRPASTLGPDIATWLDEEWRRVDDYVDTFSGRVHSHSLVSETLVSETLVSETAEQTPDSSLRSA
ncbi:MAG: 1-acyl-sn-glycerol-3-phosphate acyltransferase [Polyangiales bacterium]